MFIDETGIAITPLGMDVPEWGPVMVPLHPRTIEKLAGDLYTPRRLLDFMNNLRPRDDGRYLLLHAIGAYEYWGNNKNGDAFPEWSLKGDPMPPDVLKYVRERGLPVPAEYGYRTFETYGYVYRHHANTDRVLSIGERVCCAAYNEKMHRVELIIFVSKYKASDLIEKIDKGIPIAWSMGSRLPFDVCFSAGARIDVPNGFMPVENVEIGQPVLSFSGAFKLVTKIFKRKYTGTVFRIEAVGIPKGSWVTSNHPYYVVKEDRLRMCKGSNNDKTRRHTPGGCDTVCRLCGADIPRPEEIPVGEIEVGDYLVYPIQREKKKKNVSDAEAGILGFYLGDGSPIRQRRGQYRDSEYILQGMQFSFSQDYPDILRALVDTCLSGDYREPRVYEDNDRNAWSIHLYERTLAHRAIQVCGEGSKTKKIDDEVLGWPISARASFVGRYLDADGSVDPKKKSSRFISTSPQLIWGLRRVLLSMGIVPGVHQETATSGYTRGSCLIWVLHLNGADTWRLRKFSEKIKRYGGEVRVKRENFISGGLVYHRVTEIDESEVEDIEVHNLSVDEDESYVADGSAVHNCSVCFHPARRRSDYCVHLKTMLNKILPDGTKVFSYNYFPRFFDISEVTVPADRSAYSLKKVAEDSVFAGEAVVQVSKPSPRAVPTEEEMAKYAEMLDFMKTGGEKEAAIDKEVPAQAPAKDLGGDPIKKSLWNFIMEKVREDRSKDIEPIPASTRDLLKKAPLEKALSALTSLGILMTPGEANDVIGDREIPKGLDTSPPVSKLLQSLTGVIPGRSMFEPRFSIRIMQITRPERKNLLDLLAKTASVAYDQYVGWLRTIDLEKLSELTAHPSVQLLLSPSVIKDKMFELEEEKVASEPRDVFLPFIAGAAFEE